jgi:hypothetical protein
MLPLVLAAAAVNTAATVTARDGSVSSVDVSAPAPTHRSGIAVGLTLGVGLGGASGYPNDSEAIGDPTKFSSSGWTPGGGLSVLAMGALADYLNFGFWFQQTTYRSSGKHASATGIGFRVEAFPLVAFYPPLEGLGFFGQFGIGVGKLTTASRPEAEGTQSTLGTGAFYEWSLGHFLGGHLGIGPSLEYDALWSQPFEEHGFLASGRVVFYGGP